MQAVPDGRLACSSCYNEHYTNCYECGEVSYRVDMYSTRNPSTRQVVLICRDCREQEIWPVKPSDVSIATYTNIGSKRKYGIELETSNCPEHRTLRGKTCFGSKTDCSVQGMEFISPILYGDEGLQELENFLHLGSRFDVDNDCGYHLHLDVRDETPIQLRHIAYAYAKTYEAWKKLVATHRYNNNYCAAIQYSANDIRTYRHKIEDFFNHCNRYTWFNVYAYNCHKTFEIRIHEGTMHYKTIAYWVMAHTRFMDAVKDMKYEEIDSMLGSDTTQQFNAFKTIWNRGGQRISEFYQRRFDR